MKATSTVWGDAGGNTSIALVRTDTGIGAILPALQAASNGDWLSCWEGPVDVNGAPVVTAAEYRNVGQSAVLTFQCADTTMVALRIPAPKASIFLSDGVTVDLANTDIAAIITASIGLLASASGSLAVSCVAGLLA